MTPLRTAILLTALTSAFPGLPAFAEDAIKDNTYNMPDAVVATMGVDEAMKKMETAVKPEVLAEFKKKNPAPFWLFGEDRQLAVRNNIIPAHWFEGGAKQYGKFSGVARPGEFYVFQVAVVGGEKGVLLNADAKIPMLVGAETKIINQHVGYVSPGETKAIWVGVQIPADAKPGEYRGSVALSSSPGISGGKYTGATTVNAGVLKIGGGESTQQIDQVGGGTLVLSGSGEYVGGTSTPGTQAFLTFTLKVSGEPIKEAGTEDAWRLARLKWLDSKIGESDTEVTRPFTAIKVNEQARTLDILGRRITLGENGIPAQFTSHFSASNTKILDTGRDAFASAPNLEVIIDGKPVVFAPKEFKFTKQTPVGVEWKSTGEAGGLRLVITGHLEFDGNLQLKMRLENPRAGNEYGSVKIDDVRFVVPWAKDTAKYAMGLGLQGGLISAQHRWKWNVSKNQDSVWMGDTNIGAMLRFKGANYHRPLINAYYAFSPLALPDSWGGGGINLDTKEGKTTLVAYAGPVSVLKEGTSKGPCAKEFDIDWYFTPFKPLDLKKHFTDRIYHRTQGGQGIEKPAELKKDGANIIEVHHNRVTNPYINYPFNDDSFGALKDFIKESHAADMRVNLYYTTRELTQNLPEFFALKSLGGEVILPRKEGVKWPVTNGNGPHPWLKAHVGEDIVPAWRENLKFPQYKNALDLAVITTPDSRWNNFYLEGLDYLVKKAGIDGLYIDDTALDRKSMQRARRILDADGNTGRRVNMHSWNHFNGLAAWTNSSIAFMELYPYYDGLWHGESFNANASPEFMLVEMSGIPYGLMSEMLDHPNAWHGMVFGMRTRWPWSGDPRAQWKFESAFGIADAEFIGWFDPACPVKTGNNKIKASVFKKSGKTLIALGSWDKDTKVKLAIDWRALGLDPAKVKLTAPEIKKFQDAATFAPTDEIPVAGGKGLMLIAE